MINGGRRYRVTQARVAVTAQQDLVYLKPAADKPIVVEGIYIAAMGGAADAGDAQEELYDIEVIELGATVTAGSGGAVFTPIPDWTSDSAAAATCRVGDTTKATTSGTTKVRHPDGFNVRNPWTAPWPPEHWIWCLNATALVFRLNDTPADSILLSWTLIFTELG